MILVKLYTHLQNKSSENQCPCLPGYIDIWLSQSFPPSRNTWSSVFCNSSLAWLSFCLHISCTNSLAISFPSLVSTSVFLPIFHMLWNHKVHILSFFSFSFPPSLTDDITSCVVLMKIHVLMIRFQSYKSRLKIYIEFETQDFLFHFRRWRALNTWFPVPWV